MRKYMTKRRDLNTTNSTEIQDREDNKEKKYGTRRNTAILASLLALIFFSGIAFGYITVNNSSHSSVLMTVNQSAFPANSNNTTNTTNTTNVASNNSSANTSQASQSSQTTTTNSGTVTSTNTGTNNQNTTNAANSNSTGNTSANQ